MGQKYIRTFLCEKSGAIALLLLSLTAGAKFRKFSNYIPDEMFDFLLCLTKTRD